MKNEIKSEVEALPVIQIEGQDYQIQNNRQLDYIEAVTNYCEARNSLEKLLLFSRCAPIDENHVSDCYEPVINYRSMYNNDFLIAELNVKSIPHVRDEAASFNKAIFTDI